MASDHIGDIHTAVVREPRENFADDFTADDYTSLVQQNFPNRADNVEFTPVETVNIGGLDARQLTMTGADPGSKVKTKFLVAVIRTEQEFFKITVWTTPSEFGNQLQLMHSIIGSFRVIPGRGLSTDDDEPPPPMAAPAEPSRPAPKKN
jgi:hypothetical protein